MGPFDNSRSRPVRAVRNGTRWGTASMKPFRYTIASLWVAAAVVALDIVWLRYMLTAHRSVFGFFAEGADLGIFLMANVLPFGLYPMLHRGGERRRFLVGF